MLEKTKIFSKLEGRVEIIIVMSLILIGFLLRLLWIVKISNEPVSDFKTYYDIAVGLSKGEMPGLFGYQGPGYPLVLAAIFTLFNTTDIIYGKIFNLILSTLTMLIIYFIAKKLFEKNILAIVVLVIIALMPNYIAYNNVLGTETFFLFIFALITWLFLADFNPVFKYPLLGIIIGIAALTKPQFLVYPIILIVIHYLKEREVKKTLLKGSIIFLFMGCTILPMTIFNYLKHDQFIPVSYNGGYVLYINNNSQNTTGTYMDVTAVTPSENLLEKLEENGVSYGELNSQVSGLYQKEAINWIMDNPIAFTKLGLLRVKATFLRGAVDIQYWAMPSFLQDMQNKLPWNEFVRNLNIFTYVTSAFVLIITVFSFIFVIVGSFRILRKIKNGNIPYILSVPVINILFFLMISFAFEGQTRYNFPILYMFIIVSVYLSYRLFKKISRYNENTNK